MKGIKLKWLTVDPDGTVWLLDGRHVGFVEPRRYGGWHAAPVYTDDDRTFRHRCDAKRYLEMLVSGGLAAIDRSVRPRKALWSGKANEHQMAVYRAKRRAAVRRARHRGGRKAAKQKALDIGTFIGRTPPISVRNRLRREAWWTEERVKRCFEMLFVGKTLEESR